MHNIESKRPKNALLSCFCDPQPCMRVPCVLPDTSVLRPLVFSLARKWAVTVRLHASRVFGCWRHVSACFDRACEVPETILSPLMVPNSHLGCLHSLRGLASSTHTLTSFLDRAREHTSRYRSLGDAPSSKRHIQNALFVRFVSVRARTHALTWTLRPTLHCSAHLFSRQQILE